MITLPGWLNELNEVILADLIVTLLATSWVFWSRRELDRKRKSMILKISHELRTPLTVIKASLSLMENHKFRRPSRKEAKVLQSLNESTDKLERVVERLSGSGKWELSYDRRQHLMERYLVVAIPLMIIASVATDILLGDLGNLIDVGLPIVLLCGLLVVRWKASGY
ncbi:MAG: hypothetical protein A2126_01380 [Candidatus Woykebacteria bacterium GWB1_45_5]|uniref:histidine kinase n=1 Tax=Candidatus Woykebacteria bacterium GWB1_45_5 TaxID=1802592 RepID=A0A1G1W7R6_9BACT|nr:MAG: hypothetical protein A2126_01380 [Candidatus Woykebacteria bacterium GWB1_45_5]